MQILFYIIAAGLLGLLIKILHQFQAKKTQDNAQQSAPLPPLVRHSPPSAETRHVSSTKPEPKPDNWQNKVKALRGKGDFSQALVISAQHYPKAQAFQQSLITLRAQIKSHHAEKSDPSTTLSTLYNIAAIADLFKNPRIPIKKVKQSNISTLIQQLEKMRFPYQKIGYTNLDLLNKGDIKYLIQSWNEPKQHCHTEEFMGSNWEKLITAHSNRH